MEEIKVEKKRAIWLWLLAMVAFALIVYFVFFPGDRDFADDNIVIVPAAQNVTGGAIDNYISFIKTDTTKMGLGHEYSNMALTKLIEATKARAQALEFDIQVDLAHANDLAQRIQRDPGATTHANSIREAADIVSTALQKMQQAHYPGLNEQANEVKDAATTIDPDQLTLDQTENVKGFFSEAADLLEKMNERISKT